MLRVDDLKSINYSCIAILLCLNNEPDENTTFRRTETYEPSHEKTNIVDSAYSIDPDQPKHAAQANPDIHCSPPVDFLFQESLLYTSIPRRRNVSTRITLRGLRKLIWIDKLRGVHTVGFLVEWLIC